MKLSRAACSVYTITLSLNAMQALEIARWPQRLPCDKVDPRIDRHAATTPRPGVEPRAQFCTRINYNGIRTPALDVSSLEIFW